MAAEAGRIDELGLVDDALLMALAGRSVPRDWVAE